MTKRILHVVTNVAHYDDPDHPTGLWLSELTHAYHVFEEQGYEQRIVSPKGGLSPLEPRSLKFPNYDRTAKAWHDAAHTLKGAARGVGAWRVARVAENAERLRFDTDEDRRAFAIDSATEALDEAIGFVRVVMRSL